MPPTSGGGWICHTCRRARLARRPCPDQPDHNGDCTCACGLTFNGETPVRASQLLGAVAPKRRPDAMQRTPAQTRARNRARREARAKRALTAELRANRETAKAEGRKLVHGRVSTYTDGGCRCTRCRNAYEADARTAFTSISR